jgi:phosphoribosylformimino-5-aminoimidazole carboxamide ribotide isomerase
MIIYPAIDLRKGKCIRLFQGDYQRETVYSSDPFAMAKSFVSDGARWLHIVDLDGAKDPDQCQVSLVSELIKANDVNVQTGGGIRMQSQVENLLKQGAKRIIIGSMAVKNRETVAEWFKYFGADRLVLALDVIVNANRQPMVAVDAWQNISAYSLYDLIDYYKPFGSTHLLCTNISLDGTLNGPDHALYDALMDRFPFLTLQASGGIRSLTDIAALREKNLSGAIIGRALYEKKFTLREVLSC